MRVFCIKEDNICYIVIDGRLKYYGYIPQIMEATAQQRDDRLFKWIEDCGGIEIKDEVEIAKILLYI